jgi:uncharacterized protein
MISELKARRGQSSAVGKRFGVRRLDVFGSAARGDDFDPARRDVDLLVEFGTGAPAPSLKSFFELRDEFAAVLQRPVDLVARRALNNPFVLAETNLSSETLYAA